MIPPPYAPEGWSPRSEDDPDPGWWGAAILVGLIVFGLLVTVAVRYSPWW